MAGRATIQPILEQASVRLVAHRELSILWPGSRLNAGNGLHGNGLIPTILAILSQRAAVADAIRRL